MLEAALFAGVTPGEGFVAGTVVDHDPLDGDAEAGIPGDCGFQEGDGAFLFLGGPYVGESDAGMGVDGDMNVFPACSPGLSAFLSAPAALFCTLAGDAMAYLVETAEYFDIDVPSPYMLLVAQVKKPEKIPAVTHIDGTGRLQSVSKEVNPLYYDLINEFYNLTGIPVIINTSMNVMGEPIVNTPEQAHAMILKTDMDSLVMGNYLIGKK